MDVLPQCADLQCTKHELDAERKGGGASGRPAGATVRSYHKLFVRHWDACSDGTRAHLFVARLQADGRAALPVDVSKLLDADLPSKPFGGDEEFNFSPDGKHIGFAAHIAGMSEPWSSNFELFEASVDADAAPGFMINWIAGNWPDGFGCLVNHDGLFDQRMMYYSTEELWFPEWKNGDSYFDNPQGFEEFNPVNFVARWRTAMLVIHGQQDFRIPYTQGLATFTALQRRGIESKLLIFPGENHWVLKPANSLHCYTTVLDCLDAHVKN